MLLSHRDGAPQSQTSLPLLSSVAPAVVRPAPPTVDFSFDELEYSSLMRSLFISISSAEQLPDSPLQILFVHLEPLQTIRLLGRFGGLFGLGFFGVLPLNLGRYRQSGGRRSRGGRLREREGYGF